MVLLLYLTRRGHRRYDGQQASDPMESPRELEQPLAESKQPSSSIRETIIVISPDGETRPVSGTQTHRASQFSHRTHRSGGTLGSSVPQLPDLPSISSGLLSQSYRYSYRMSQVPSHLSPPGTPVYSEKTPRTSFRSSRIPSVIGNVLGSDQVLLPNSTLLEAPAAGGGETPPGPAGDSRDQAVARAHDCQCGLEPCKCRRATDGGVRLAGGRPGEEVEGDVDGAQRSDSVGSMLPPMYGGFDGA
ncbi:hypothetical protein DICSQDRAFT_182644 [Dichomitus squalens LYAD-421 SS1]|uniref:Uncharacterized protein n=2 Tax=Dichomitus squalens TaxID=114155 RepID=A0A4Q9MEU1_9APHY|nr:uncharacterized protein DICSQDRAFT_182644 [Dichomitus squalens LYAD-421 SS1]EJF58268.1 hypothetical protein DICSQDRAFT_182644 [Dichomitus squalens LYAD-421 SS1]TBU25789.1 hypothetical protein BD311DRAFT_780081 [Dichomitus squalens]TBU57561.1 hypothetical protein BD310DRAFT_949291 [Dichomitus squalens]